jgi:serine/threonine protein kinase
MNRSLRLNNFFEIRKKLTKTLSFKNEGCIYPIDRPEKGGYQHYWAVIKEGNTPKFLIKKQIGYKTSEDGEAHEICFIDNEKNDVNEFLCESGNKYNIIAKLAPINKDALDNSKNITYFPWREDFINYLMGLILFNGISPYFCYYYGSYTCKNASQYMFKNVNIIRRFKNQSILTDIQKEIVVIGKKISQLEIAYDEIESLLRKNKDLDAAISKKIKPNYGHGVYTAFIERGGKDLYNYLEVLSGITNEFIYCISFQILQALIAMHETFNVIHMDLHLYNILVFEHDIKNKYITYKIYTQKFYVPLCGIDLRIIDFGRSMIVKYQKNEKLANEAREQYELFMGPNTGFDFYKKVLNNLNRNRKYYTECFKSFDVFRVFNELLHSLKDTIPKESVNFLESIVNDSSADFEQHFVQRERKNGLIGTPLQILQKYFINKDIFTSIDEKYKPLIDNDVHQEYIIDRKNIKNINEVLKKKLRDPIKFD